MNEVSLESEYEKIKGSTLDDWKNIQRSDPWEDPDFLQRRNPEILKTKKLDYADFLKINIFINYDSHYTLLSSGERIPDVQKPGYEKCAGR